MCFFAVLALWLLFPVLIRDNLAQDAVPYVVAGELVTTRPDVIYAEDATDLYDLRDAFAARSCAISPPGTDCESLSVAFVSPPQGLPFAFVLSRLGPGPAVLVMRLLAAGALCGGMLVLWSRLAHRTPRAGPALAVTAVLLTPFTMVPLPLGQTSPYLFLSACLGVRFSDDRRRWPVIAVAALWALTISLKLFPVALVAIVVWQRRARLLAWAAGFGALLTAGALALGPVSLFGGFVVASGVLAEGSSTNPYNGSVGAVLAGLWPPTADQPVIAGLLLGVRVVVVAGLAWWRIRRSDDDVQWAWAWLALLLFVPLVWAHYLWLGIAAVGVVVSARRDIDDRVLMALPALALTTLPIAIPNATGSSASGLQLLFLVGSLGLATWLAQPALEPAPAVDVHPPAGP